MSEQNIINKYINELATANHTKFVQQDQIETLSQQLAEKDSLINTLKQELANKNEVIEGKVVS